MLSFHWQCPLTGVWHQRIHIVNREVKCQLTDPVLCKVKKKNDNLKQMSKYLHSYNMTQQAFPKNVIVFFKCGSLPDIQKETTSTQAAHTYQKFLVHSFDSTR